MTMDVDDDENGTQRPKAVADYGVEVDFRKLNSDNKDDPGEAIPLLDKEIIDKTAEIERMAPNMKAMERSVIFRS